MRQHTIIGKRILLAAPCARTARSSPQATNATTATATATPAQLAGAAIPLPARIVAVCDAFDAMCEQRPYNDSLTRWPSFAADRAGSSIPKWSKRSLASAGASAR